MSDEILLLVGELKGGVEHNREGISDLKNEGGTLRSENREQHESVEGRLDGLSDAVSGLDGYLRGYGDGEASGGSTGRLITDIIEEVKVAGKGTKALLFLLLGVGLVTGVSLDGVLMP